MGCAASVPIPVAEDTQLVGLSSAIEQKTSWFNHLYARYIPSMVIERFAAKTAQPLKEAEREYFEAAVAFVDISGFTKLSV